ncbi:hypothetical protein IP92_01309 [Pseudoduganella flava]|uniref:Uncharacterized protein n=1 Tax=Pseudoduganella flava TaxID=871742 RepID=A0A562Q065_9BURK|nr:hypothetical protein [Pseudoduganella flava]QGZ38373.1 hypothetical protein GO485_04440 [Pseudoduganella flava]TWI50082.1 hypothetical protein IP92_01309 [Pseudoduganella flava]
MPKLNRFGNREEFLQRYLKPLLVEPLEARLNASPDYVQTLPAGAVVDRDGGLDAKSGAGGRTGERARFVGTANGWNYRDQVLLRWQLPGDVTHHRESEQDQHYTVTMTDQPDLSGVLRPTIDLHASLMRYERDALGRPGADGAQAELGKAWARVTLQWSLRLQLVEGVGGQVHLVSRARKAPPVTDAGKAGAYIVADPLAHLLNVPRLAHGWEHGTASLAAVQDYLVARLAAAIEPTLANHAHV